MQAVLLQPKTYMNVIGVNVSAALKSFQIDKSQLYVFHDELEKKLGVARVVKGTSFK
jgi:peptidyl-tRNA hydrolase